MAFPIQLLESKITQVLPTVYDESLSFYELLNKVTEKLNEVIQESNDYFNEDVSIHIERILTEWREDGTLSDIITSTVFVDFETTLGVHTEQIDGILTKTDIFVTPEQFGAIGDGIADDTTALQEMLATGLPAKLTGTYFVSDYLELVSGQNIYSDNATILSNVGGHRVGAIQIKGDLIGTKHFLVGDVPVTSDRVTLPAGSGANYSPGDYVWIDQTYPEGIDYTTHTQRFVGFLTEIVSIEGDVLLLADHLPHGYQSANSPSVQKVEPIRNVTIDGTLTIDKMGSVTQTDSVEVEYGINITIKGITGVNSGGKTVIVKKSRHFIVDQVHTSRPTNTGPGQGYSVQAMSSNNGLIQNVTGTRTRHTVDVAEGSVAIGVNHCTGYKNITSTFSTHGQNNKHICFTGCKSFGGVYGFSIGNTSYLSDEHLSFIECLAVECSDSGFNVGFQSREIQIIGCKTIDCTNGVNIVESLKISGSVRIINGGYSGLKIDKGSKEVNIDVTIEGVFSDYGVIIDRDSFNVDIRGSVVIEGKDCISIRSTTTGSAFSGHVRINCKRIEITGTYADKKAVRSMVKDVDIFDSTIIGNIMCLHNGARVINNRIKGDLDLRGTKGVYYVNNLGTMSVWNLGVHDGVDIIRQNNIENYVF
jgi:hypothetical protein